MKLQFLILREEFPINVAAIVTARQTDKVKTATELRVAITNAVTEWMETTNAGIGAWQYAGDDFNIGDLSSNIELPELVALFHLSHSLTRSPPLFFLVLKAAIWVRCVNEWW